MGIQWITGKEGGGGGEAPEEEEEEEEMNTVIRSRRHCIVKVV